ncbi:MAG: hypothetical protein OK474_05750 [Thaumarchaeota archaeon]|nr:hypothetical protein [Nitrososphaerota archaeon]
MKSDMVKPFVIGMLALQVLTVALLWLLDAFSIQATAAFAFLLAANVMVFAIVAHVYRTTKDQTTEAGSPAPAAGSPAQIVGIAPEYRHEKSGTVLPRSVHLGVPIGSMLVLLAFAFTISLPANGAPIPVQSTLYFIPIYVAIVIVLVFGSMYLFKAVMEKDLPRTEYSSHP